MLYAYKIPFDKLYINASDSPSMYPLVFSAAQFSPRNQKPYGIIAIEGKVFVGTLEELPVFVKYKNGGVDILPSPSVEAIKDSEFAVSGITLLNLEYKKIDIPKTLNLNLFTPVPRIVLGLMDKSLFLLYGEYSLEQIYFLLNYFNVHTSILLSSSNIFFHNPREGIKIGVQPFITLQASEYSMSHSPVIALDPIHRGHRNPLHIKEHKITLEMTRRMQEHLKAKYKGTFLLTRTQDVPVSDKDKVKFLSATRADYIYSLQCGSSKLGLDRGVTYGYFESEGSITRDIINLSSNYAQSKLRTLRVDVHNPFATRSKADVEMPCPTLLAKYLYVDNIKDLHILSNRKLLESLCIIQAEALAEGLKLSPKVEKDFVEESNLIYRVHVGTFRHKSSALALRDRLILQGYPAYISDN